MGNPVSATSPDSKVAGVKGECTGGGGFGVWGVCDSGNGVHGDSKTSRGVVGTSETFHGVFGKSRDNAGVAADGFNTAPCSHTFPLRTVIPASGLNGVSVEAITSRL